MEAVRGEEFLQWASEVAIGFDPESGCLHLLPLRKHARFWVLPSDPATWPHFVVSLLDALDEWASGFLWPRYGRWPVSARSQSYDQVVRDVLLRGAGIPGGWEGAVRFTREEDDALVAVLYAALAFGCCVYDDLFFVPDHGRQLLQTDHHDVIHVRCSSEDRVQRLVAEMAKAGYQLPREPPDGTFKIPAWMDSGEPGAVPDPGGIPSRLLRIGSPPMAIDDSGQWWVGSEAADIQDYLAALTRSDGGYPSTSYRPIQCNCGSVRFTLDRAGDIARRTCEACGAAKFICRKREDWEEAEAEEGAEPYACVECGTKEANLTVGFAGYEDPKIDGLKWFFVGVRCVECGVLSCFSDGKIGWGPAHDVYETA
jgi:hypothetical protein